MSQLENRNSPKTLMLDKDEIDIGFVLGTLWDHKIVISLITLAFLLGGYVASNLMTPQFMADSLVQVEQKPGTIGGADIEQLLGGSELNTSAEIEILKSRMILGQVVDQVDLDIVVLPKVWPVIGGWILRSGIKRPQFLRNSSVVWAGEYVSVSELVTEHDSGSFGLVLRTEEGKQYTLLDEQGAEIATGQVGKRLVVEDPWFELLVSDLEAAPGAEFIIEKRDSLSAINSLKSRLDIQALGGRKETGILRISLKGEDPFEIVESLDATTQIFVTQNISRQAAEADKSLEFLEAQAPQIREQLTSAENRLNEYRLKNDSVDLTFETESALSTLVSIEASLNELELRESELSRRFTPNHPVYESLLEKKGQLLREKARLEARTDNLPETQQQVLRLSRDVEVTQQIYVQLLNRMQELRIARAGTVGNVRVLDKAVMQGQISPQRTRILILASLAGFLLAAFLVLLRSILNRGVVAPEQLEEMGLSVYATVPLSESESQKKDLIRKRKGSVKGHMLLAEANPADLAIEAIRALRTSLHFAMMDQVNNRLTITGPSPGIGKSFISANLAAVCAQAGLNVVLVDADLRKGHIHEIFGGMSQDGLSEVLSGALENESCIRATSTPGLSWVSRGSSPPNPSELLMQSRFDEFLNFLSGRFDLVIVDTPPVLAVTDAAIIGKSCDTCLMVVRFGSNAPKEIEIANQRLATAGVPVKGVILNAMEKKAATSYGYYGYYNYSYKSD